MIIRILQQAFEVPDRIWEAGHICTEAEASVLTQIFKENIQKNLRLRVKSYLDNSRFEILEPQYHQELQKIVADYTNKYEFPSPGQTAPARTTPLEQHHRTIVLDRARADLGLGPDEQPPEIVVETLMLDSKLYHQAWERTVAEINQGRKSFSALAQENL